MAGGALLAVEDTGWEAAAGLETAAGAEETVDWETVAGAEDTAGASALEDTSGIEEAAASEETAPDSGFSASLLTGAELTSEEVTSELTGAELTISLEVTSGSIVAAVFALLHPPKEAAMISKDITAASFFLFVYFMDMPSYCWMIDFLILGSIPCH